MDQLRLRPEFPSARGTVIRTGRAGHITAPESNWLRSIKKAESTPRALLVLLPHAGGGAHGYAPWAPVLPADITTVAVEYPGHGTRMREPLMSDLADVVSDLCELLSEVDNRSLIVGGHSLGAFVGYEVAEELQERGHPVAGLFLSGAVPPHRRAQIADLSALDDDSLAEELSARGDLPQEIVQDREARELYLPIVKNDLRLARRYRRWGDRSRARSRARAVVVGGEQDPSAPSADLAGWSDLIDGPTEITVLPGGHFYYRGQLPAVGRLIDGLVTSLDGTRNAEQG